MEQTKSSKREWVPSNQTHYFQVFVIGWAVGMAMGVAICSLGPVAVKEVLEWWTRYIG